MNDAQMDCVVETMLAGINYAAALDLERQPRLSRTSAGTFTLYSVSTKRPCICLEKQYLISLLCHLYS